MNERTRSQGSVGRSAPVWVPDTSSSTCQECRVKFSFVVRKHHCRACGRLLCSRCSQHQAALHYLGGTLGRVCQACHGEIESNKNKPNMRRTKSLNDFDKMKENISKLIRSQQLAQVESAEQDTSGSITSFISVLPLELLSKILEFLPFEDIKQCRLVCRFWQAVSLTDFCSRSYVNLPEWVEEKVETLGIVTSQTSFKHFKLHNFPFDGNNIPLTSPTTLILKDCEITSFELMRLLSHISGLKTLGLINCKQLFMSGMFLNNQVERKTFEESLKGLTCLQLDLNSYLSDVLLLRICGGLESLKELSLASCNIMNHKSGIVTRMYPECEDLPASSSVVTWRIVVRIIQNFSPTLKSLSLANNIGITIEDLCQCEGLQLNSLNLSGCTSVSTDGFLSLVRSQPNLVRLNIAASRKIFSCLKEQTEEIFQALKPVKHLDISENSIPHLKYLASLDKLEDLVMHNIDSPSSEICEALTTKPSVQLQTFKSKYLSLSNSKMLAVLNHRKLSGLVHLELPDCPDDVMDDPVMTAICDNLPCLHHLDLRGNPGITDIGTLDLLQDHSWTKDRIKDSLKEKVLLGSRAEIEMVLERKRQSFAVELMQHNEEGVRLCRSGISKLMKLRYLNLSGSSISSLTLSHGLQCVDLRQLHLSDCRGGLVSEQGLVQLTKIITGLIHLSLASSCITDLGLVEIVSCLARLEHLDVRRCGGLTSGVLPPLAHLAPNLNTLLISGCPAIYPEAVKSVVPHLKYIKTIDL